MYAIKIPITAGIIAILIKDRTYRMPITIMINPISDQEKIPILLMGCTVDFEDFFTLYIKHTTRIDKLVNFLA